MNANTTRTATPTSVLVADVQPGDQVNLGGPRGVVTSTTTDNGDTLLTVLIPSSARLFVIRR